MYQNIGEEKEIECRICLEESLYNKDFIVPCQCRGSARFIHRDCLDKTRSINEKMFKSCNECGFEYIIEDFPEDKKKEARLNMMYHLYVMRDVITFILLNEILICILQIVVIACDKESIITKKHGFMKFFIYHNVSIVLYLAVIGSVVLLLFLLKGSNSRDISRGIRIQSGNEALFYLIILALFGLVIGLMWGIEELGKRSVMHREQLWKYTEAKKKIVKDLYIP